jgi:hypothetical protein
MPNTKILLSGINLRLGDLEKKVQTTNAIISKFNDDKHAFYLDMSNAFQDSPGNEKTGLFVDTIYPSALGISGLVPNNGTFTSKVTQIK